MMNIEDGYFTVGSTPSENGISTPHHYATHQNPKPNITLQ